MSQRSILQSANNTMVFLAICQEKIDILIVIGNKSWSHLTARRDSLRITKSNEIRNTER